MILGSRSPRNPNLIHHLGQLLRQGAKNDRLEKGIAICASGATSMDWTTARFTRPKIKTNTDFLMFPRQYGRKSESVPCNQVEPPPYPPNKKLMGIHVHFLDMQANCLAQVDPLRTTGRGQHIKNMTCCYHLLPSSFSFESLKT